MVVLDPAGRSPRSTSSRRTTTRSRSGIYKVDPSDISGVRPLPVASSGTRTIRRRCRARKCSTARRRRRSRRTSSSRRSIDLAPALNEVRLRSRDRDRRAVPVEREVGSAAHDRVGAVDEARGRRARRWREPARVRDRPRDRQAARGRRARDPAVRHHRQDRRAGPRDDAARRRAQRGTHYCARDEGRRRRVRSPRTDGTGTTTAAGTSSRATSSSPGTSSTIASCTSRARKSRSRAGCA